MSKININFIQLIKRPGNDLFLICVICFIISLTTNLFGGDVRWFSLLFLLIGFISLIGCICIRKLTKNSSRAESLEERKQDKPGG